MESCDAVAHPSALPAGDGSVENHLASQAALIQDHVINCEGFTLHVVQRGGPPLDPSKLHRRDEKDVATELEKWANKVLSKRPNTWRTLYVSTQSSVTSDDATAPRSSVLEQPCHGRRAGDVVLAATVISELTLEPFEL